VTPKLFDELLAESLLIRSGLLQNPSRLFRVGPDGPEVHIARESEVLVALQQFLVELPCIGGLLGPFEAAGLVVDRVGDVPADVRRCVTRIGSLKAPVEVSTLWLSELDDMIPVNIRIDRIKKVRITVNESLKPIDFELKRDPWRRYPAYDFEKPVKIRQLKIQIIERESSKGGLSVSGFKAITLTTHRFSSSRVAVWSRKSSDYSGPRSSPPPPRRCFEDLPIPN